MLSSLKYNKEAIGRVHTGNLKTLTYSASFSF
nr:MAG TPA: hypothetical protein [Bacteriophage sp.]